MRTVLTPSKWGGRLWSVKTTFWQPALGGYWDEEGSGFIMQWVALLTVLTDRRIVCLIIAPTFFSAANYIFLGK